MNLTATRAIYVFEMARWGRTLAQSIVAPVLSTSLYFIVFGAAIGSRVPEIDEDVFERVLPRLDVGDLEAGVAHRIEERRDARAFRSRVVGVGQRAAVGTKLQPVAGERFGNCLER